MRIALPPSCKAYNISVNVADIAVGNERLKLKIANRVAVDPTIRITLPKSRMRVHVDDALPDLSGR
ncbi:MAG: hypothetical protein BGO06_23885 [Shinella sp. 65-6]|nr:MAG: hypothetical protein BGO06_23885 [Shinella sp. 65-6]